jgi:hypothetical protein
VDVKKDWLPLARLANHIRHILCAMDDPQARADDHERAIAAVELAARDGIDDPRFCDPLGLAPGQWMVRLVKWARESRYAHHATEERAGEIRAALSDMVADVMNVRDVAKRPETAPAMEATAIKPPAGKGRKPKRSTTNGDAKAKIIAGLSAWHKYDNGSCGNPEPVVLNVFSKKIDVAPASVSDFFRVHFDGHAKYKATCTRDLTRIALWLTGLNQDFTAVKLYGAIPPGESERRADD